MASELLTDSLRETLDVFDGSGTPRTTTEVADRLGLGRRSTYDRLERLADGGWLETKKVGASGRVWWRPQSAPDGRDALLPDGVPATDFPGDEVLGAAEVGVFVLDGNYDVAWLNEAAERYFGLDREGTLGRDKRRLIEERIAPVVDDPASFAETVRATYDDDAGPERFECRVTQGDGRAARWLEHRSKPIESGAFEGGRIELYYDVTDWKRPDRVEQERRAQFESLVETVEEYAIFLLDAAGRVRTWNPGAERIKGYGAEEVLGEHFSTFYTAQDRAAGVPERNLRAAERRGSVEDEGWRVRADGSRFWANVTITPLYEGEELTGYAKVTRDLTDRREREHEIRRERELLERILETSPVGILVLDGEGTIVRTNDRTGDLLDRPGTDLEGRCYDDLAWTSSDDGDPIAPDEHPVARALATGSPVGGVDLGITLPDGTDRWLSVSAAPVGGEAGDVERVVVALENVTRLRERTRRLERQREDLVAELNDVFDRISDGVYGLDENLRFTYVNDRAEALLGVEESAVLGGDVREEIRVTDRFEAALDEALEEREPVFLEEYYEPLDGWFENALYPSETGLSVYFRDVTDRKEREQELERYRTIVETIGDAIFVVDGDQRFTMVNRAACELSGYEREELVGMPVADLVGEDAAARALDLGDSLDVEAGDVASAEFTLATADGGEVPIETRFTRVLTGVGTIDSVGVAHDVTEQKQFEETLTTLYDSARELLGAGTKAEVSEVVAETATDVLDLSGVITYQYDADDGYLHPVAQSGDTRVMRTEFPSVPPDDSSLTGHTYAAGEFRQFDDVTESPHLDDDARDTAMRAGIFAPMSDHGVLVVGSRTVDAFDERTRRLVELLAANAEAAYDRVEREHALEESERRYRTLVDNFPNGAVTLFDEDLRYLIAGGEAFDALGIPAEDLEGDRLVDRLPGELAGDLAPRYRAVFEGEASEFEVEFDGQIRHVRVYPVHDEEGSVVAGMGMSQDITRRRKRERTLERQREQLAALNQLNEIVHDVTDAVIEQSSRAEIEETVCERLAETESYTFAWIGDVDTRTGTVKGRTEAGVEGYLDDIVISVDPDDATGRGPAGRAVRTREMQVTPDARTDPDFEPWQEDAERYGYRSSAAIPIVHGDTLYGLLGIYADRPEAFAGRERSVLGRLGEIIGHAIASVQRKRALMSDEVVGLDILIRDVFDAVDVPVAPDGDIEVDRTVAVGDGVYLAYGSATGDGIGAVEALVEAETVPHWESVTVVGSDGDAIRFVVRLTDPPVLTTVASHGGYVREFRIEDGDSFVTIHLAPGAGVSRVVEAVRAAYSGVELTTKRQMTRRDAADRGIDRLILDDLTDRQRSALEAALYAGYFEWPRESTGEEVAESLGVSAPTFHGHLRKAQRTVLERLLGSHGPVVASE